MEKFYILLTFTLAIAINTLAQPVLTYNSMLPEVGTSYTTHNIDPSTITHGDNGANILWDYSGISSTSSNTSDYVAVSSTPNGSDFAEANFCIYSQEYQSYGYFNYDSNAYSLVGAATPTGIVMSYGNVETMNAYPFTYNDVSNDDFECDFVAGVAFNRTGSITTTAVGYGTLVLPSGSYDNVLKIKMEETYQDVFDVGTGPQTTLYTSTNYYWYKPGTTEPLLLITALSSNSVSISETASYLDGDDISSSIKENFIDKSLNIYPNPVEDVLNFNMEFPASTHYQICDLTGKLLKEGRLDFSNRIMLSELKQGSYVIKLINDHNIQSLRFVKE